MFIQQLIFVESKKKKKINQLLYLQDFYSYQNKLNTSFNCKVSQDYMALIIIISY